MTVTTSPLLMKWYNSRFKLLKALFNSHAVPNFIIILKFQEKYFTDRDKWYGITTIYSASISKYTCLLKRNQGLVKDKWQCSPVHCWCIGIIQDLHFVHDIFNVIFELHKSTKSEFKLKLQTKASPNCAPLVYWYQSRFSLLRAWLNLHEL